MRAWRVGRSAGVVTLAVMLLLWLGTHAHGRQATIAPCPTLPADARIEREVAGEGQACYEVSLKPGELFRVRVWQKDSEILLRLLGAGDAELARMSSPREWEGLEILSFVAPEAGSYRLEAGLLDKQVGKGTFTILREPARAATAADRRRVEVERLFAEGMVARDGTGTAETAIKKFSEASAGWRELGDEYMTRLSDLLVTRSRARATFIEGRNLLNKTPPDPDRANYRAASVKFQEARHLYNEGGESINEGASLLGAALAEQGLGRVAESINFVEQSLPIFSGDKSVKVDLLNNLVTFYLILNDIDSAIRRSLEAHSIYAEDLKQPDLAAAVANNLGALYLEIGKNDEAFKYLSESLQQRERSGDRCGLPATLSSLGVYYYAIGKKAQAKEFLLDKALPKYPDGYECSIDKSQTLISIGKFYYDLGANDLALEYLGRADALVKINLEAIKGLNNDDLGAKAGIATLRANTMLDGGTMLNYVGAANFASAREREAAIPLTRLSPRRAAEARAQVRKLYDKALSSYEEALRLYRGISDKRHEATVMTNIGVVLATSGRTVEAMAIFNKALTVGRNTEDKDAEGITLSNIGEVYSARGQYRRALDYFNSALPLLKAVNDKGGEAIALADSMNAWGRVGNRRMAIFCGKQAVNIFQELRGSARGLNTEIQKDYLRRVRGSYQRLAELLVAEGLYAQAVQTLNLYQDQQFFDFDRNASVGQAAFTDRERDWARRYDAAGGTLARLSTRIDGVKRQIGYRQPTAEQRAELERLKSEFERVVGDFGGGVVGGAEKEFAQPPEAQDKVADVTPVAKMQGALGSVEEAAREKGSRQKVFALYTLIGAERFYVFLLKPGVIEAYTHPTGSAELNRLALNAQSDLQNPGFPEKILDSSSKLYNVILRATSTRDGKSLLEAELEREKPDVLLWSLDGAMSYLPAAALYDARRSQYLVERYQNVVFTRADAERITRAPVEWGNAVGFGKSTPTEARCEVPCDKPGCDRLKGLGNVRQEMATIFTGTLGEPALLKGEVVLDGKFTREALVKGSLPPLVHVASHFCFRPGDAEGSFLLLGDDSKFSLNQMRAYPELYAGVDLLVLSACQTAALEPNQVGKEIDSLAELSQRLKAASVLATLWKADDIGASRLMIRFYSLHRLHKEWSKAELLRRAQLDLLKGVETVPDANLEHPYFWAPFVLYGSFR